MHKIIVIGLLVLFLGGSAGAGELALIDFGSCQIEVTNVREIDQFTGENGDIVKPSRRDARFIEVKLSCAAIEEGEFALYPSMFGALFRYRGLAQIVPAVALGTKISDKVTGETKEYWYNEPDVSIVIGVSANERFSKYLILEISKEVNDFVLQGPMSIQTLTLEH